MKLREGHTCVVKVVLPGQWPMWYFARIASYDEDEQGNWSVDRFRVYGETFDRDTHEGIFVIRDEGREAIASKLAKAQWTPTPYASADAVRAAILENEKCST